MARHFKSDDSTSASRKPARKMQLSEGTESIRVLSAKDVRPEWDEKDHGALRTFLGAFFGVLALLAMAVVVIGFVLNGSISLRGSDKAVTQALTDVAEGEPFYMLVVGTDSSESDYSGTADVLTLARVEPQTATLTMVSIPRDTMVHIGGSDSVEKINASYAYYGATSTLETVSAFAGVPIHHFAKVNYAGLERAIDQLGGITVNVPEAVDIDGGKIHLEAGEQLMDGKTAMAYAREPFSVNGVNLSNLHSQRLVLSAILHATLDAPISQKPALATTLAGSFSTDLTLPELGKLALQLRGKELTIRGAVTPSYSFVQDGFTQVGTMFDEWRDMMKRVDAGLDPLDLEAEIPEPQASSETLGAATNSAAPQDYKELAAQAMAASAEAAGEAEAASE